MEQTHSIDAIRAWHVSLPMSRVFKSAQSRVSDRRLIVIAVHSGDHVGWGEAAPVAGHAGPATSVLWDALTDIKDPRTKIKDGLLAAALNQAVSDVAAKKLERPLWAVVGGSGHVAASAAIGVDNSGAPDSDQLLSAIAEGYLHLKLKITPATSPNDLAELIGSHPEIGFGLDANGSFEQEHKEALLAIDGVGASYLEQPGPAADLAFHAALRLAMETPIALDESADSSEAVDAILAAGAADIVTIKPGRFGTGQAVALAQRATASALGARVGGLLESGIGRAHAVAAASHPSFTVIGDIAASDRYFTDDLVRPQWRLQDGLLYLPTGPGIGVNVDTDAIDAHSIASFSVG